jgi:phage shock protein B
MEPIPVLPYIPYLIPIIFILTVGSVIKHIVGSKQKYQAKTDNSDQAERVRDLENLCARLEDRIQVLERIATDQKSQLRENINALG